jgi:hypothetical protein
VVVAGFEDGGGSVGLTLSTLLEASCAFGNRDGCTKEVAGATPALRAADVGVRNGLLSPFRLVAAKVGRRSVVVAPSLFHGEAAEISHSLPEDLTSRSAFTEWRRRISGCARKNVPKSARLLVFATRFTAEQRGFLISRTMSQVCAPAYLVCAAKFQVNPAMLGCALAGSKRNQQCSGVRTRGDTWNTPGFTGSARCSGRCARAQHSFGACS